MAWLAPMLVGLVLGVAMVLAGARLLNRRHSSRRTALLLAQPLMALLLYLALFPPRQPVARGLMTVLTADAAKVQSTAAQSAGGLRIALPEAGSSQEAETAPDLATALRRHPGIRQLHVIGAGLTARDREAARGLALTFDAAEAPAGLVDLDMPAEVVAGNRFSVSGRVAKLPNASVRLLDPAAQVIQRTQADAQGQFALSGAVRTAGLANFSLQVHDAASALRETLPLPIRVAPAPTLRLLVLAGAPGPELKYLRRWALDAGLSLHTRTSVGAGLTLGDAPLALDERTLRDFDAVLLDGRSLHALRSTDRRALELALRSGLGVLLRVDDPPGADERRWLHELGFDVDARSVLATTQLAADRGSAPTLTRRALRLHTPDAVPMLNDVEGQPLAWWRAEGLGRIGLMTLTDSYRLTLAGFSDQHGEIWSALLGAIARTTSAAPPPTAPWPLWQAERAALCGIADHAEVMAPDGTRIALAVDPATGERRCAALWPTQAGWYQLQQGEVQMRFAVLPATSGVAWQAQRQLDATALLAGGASTTTAHADASRRGPALPWLAAWLLLSTLVWLVERREKAAALADAAEAVGNPTA